ncbi:MAG: hypothetical protein H0U76_02045 [Ktedonobacteraceae bacterium]|nr:hypothetical protein [Ktedonobacteraceae bacterium]
MQVVGDLIVVWMWIIFLGFIITGVVGYFLVAALGTYSEVTEYLEDTRTLVLVAIGGGCGALCLVGEFFMAIGSGTAGPLSDGKIVAEIVFTILALVGFTTGWRAIGLLRAAIIRAERGEPLYVEGKVRTLTMKEEKDQSLVKP